MTSRIHKTLFICIFSLVCMVPVFVSAEDAQILSVTPPLFQLSALPGGLWQSSVKVVNGNSYPLTVYTEVVNFEGMGNGGQGRFIPISSEEEDVTFAEWITIDKGPHIIPPEETVNITFFAELPENAAPGGHYAAILVSTEEPKKTGELSVLTSQAVTSLLFLRVEGDVREEGSIREFRTTKSFLDTPEAEFLLRFENKGNVHILPRGNIVITNMWGKERGSIPINEKTNYGNVLPLSIREFTFGWKSDFTFADIGRYKAIVTLGYGEDGIKNVTSTTYFWVIPLKWTFITILILALFVWLIVTMVRAYVRRMLVLAGVNPDKQKNLEKDTTMEKRGKDSHVLQVSRSKNRYRTVSAPIRDGVLDLRSRLTSEKDRSRFSIITQYILTYKSFFLSVCALFVIFVCISLYIEMATRDDVEYAATVREDDGSTTILPKEK